MAMYFRPRALRGLGHFADAGRAVGRRGVHVQIAADVVEFDELRQLVLLGQFDFAAVFAQFRRNPRQIDGGVDVFFRACRRRISRRETRRIR